MFHDSSLNQSINTHPLTDTIPRKVVLVCSRLNELLQSAHEAWRKQQPVDGRCGVVRRIRFASLEIDDFELGSVRRRRDNVERLVASLAPIVRIFDLDQTLPSVQHIKDLDSVIVSHEKEWEALSMEAWHLVKLKVVRVAAVGWYSPVYFGSDGFLNSVQHVKLLVVLNAHNELVGHVFDATRYVSICKVSLSEGHYELEGAFVRVTLQLTKEHAIVATEADLTLASRHDDVEDSIDLEGLRHENLAHGVHFDNVDVTKVLAEDEELFANTIILVLKKLNVVDSLLQFFVVLLFKSVNVKDKQVAIVTADPS